MTAVHTSGLTVRYGDRVALRDATVTVEAGELIGVAGPNGAGKSTLLKALAGLVPVHAGRVEVSGQSGTRRDIAYVAQRATVDWDYPAQVHEVVAMGRYPHLGPWRRPGRLDRRVVEEAMGRLDLTDLSRRPLRELSGGQAQRVFLARALAQEASVLLLDEPLAGVDATSAGLLNRELRAVADSGAAVLVVSHDLGSCERFDRLVLLSGTVVAEGPAREVLTAERLAQAYGGPLHDSPWTSEAGSWTG